MVRIEPPEWYRTFHLENWDEPDGRELEMADGGSGRLPDELREVHARRRWGESKHRFRQANPAFASQEFADLRTRYAVKRRLV